MAKVNRVPAVSDASVPGAGRVYDYLLGGNHNFEIDRTAAEGLRKDFPFIPQGARLTRWFLGTAIRQLADEGFTKFIDFASGLPTMDHIHEVAPKGTKVIYSDIDPVTVAYGETILKGLSQVAFVPGDAGSPESVLSLPVVERLFGSDRKAAIGFNGIAWFLPDERVQHALSVLHDWASPGAKLFLCDVDYSFKTPEAEKAKDFYALVGEPVFYRTERLLRELLGKWKICEPGIKPLTEWLPVDKEPIEKAMHAMGGGLIGAILEKS